MISHSPLLHTYNLALELEPLLLLGILEVPAD